MLQLLDPGTCMRLVPLGTFVEHETTKHTRAPYLDSRMPAVSEVGMNEIEVWVFEVVDPALVV